MVVPISILLYGQDLLLLIILEGLQDFKTFRGLVVLVDSLYCRRKRNSRSVFFLVFKDKIRWDMKRKYK